MIQPQRILHRNNKAIQNGKIVLYWMQAAQRAEWNHALEYAISVANERKKPVLAAFCISDDFPEANERHYAFMLEGLKETQGSLAKRNIPLVVFHGKPEETIPKIAKDADLLVMDEGYLRIQQQWRDVIAEAADCAVCEVTTNLIVPVEEASEKENFSAGTLRPRITKQLKKYLMPLRHVKANATMSFAFGEKTCHPLGKTCHPFNITNIEKALKKLSIDQSVKASPCFCGGTSEAKKRLKQFIKDKLDDYADRRNDPILDCQSNLSPYLHFGQISPLYIALEIQKSTAKKKCKDAFLEELIVRRELSHNFVYYNPQYDKYDALPPWALRTLNFHAKDKREYTYTIEQFEKARTHDPYWNAAQIEMVMTGKMHNYLRMYWGKKILEWAKSPKNAFKIALYLNNKYELDGRDPNGFAGVAWCFGKHDRAWGERPIFGKVRYMNAAGLKRKFNIDAYVKKINTLVK